MRKLRLAENHLGYKPYDFVLCNDFLDAKQNRTTPLPRKKNPFGNILMNYTESMTQLLISRAHH